MASKQPWEINALAAEIETISAMIAALGALAEAGKGADQPTPGTWQEILFGIESHLDRIANDLRSIPEEHEARLVSKDYNNSPIRK